MYLEEELDAAIGRLADRRGQSRSETIRRALREATAEVRRPRLTAIGIPGDPGRPTDVAANVDDYLERWGFGRE